MLEVAIYVLQLSILCNLYQLRKKFSFHRPLALTHYFLMNQKTNDILNCSSFQPRQFCSIDFFIFYNFMNLRLRDSSHHIICAKILPDIVIHNSSFNFENSWESTVSLYPSSSSNWGRILTIFQFAFRKIKRQYIFQNNMFGESNILIYCLIFDFPENDQISARKRWLPIDVNETFILKLLEL